MTIPEGLNKCPKCGEYHGQVKSRDLNWELPLIDEDPDRIIKVTCLCDGITCPKCNKNKIHRPISNSYDEESNTIGHWPYFSGLMHCDECKKGERLETSDHNMIKDFIRIGEYQEVIRIEVCEISWDGPHTPVSTWVSHTELSVITSQSDIDRAVKNILHDKRYFSVCTECGERNPNGWMFDESICQDCAQFNHGIVF